MPQHYLVTGCAGFIGSNIVEQLLAAGHRVTGIDNLNNSYDVRLKTWRLEQLPKFDFHQVDITDRDALAPLFHIDTPFAAVIHQAARAGVRPSVDDPWSYCRANIDGTLNLLDACRRHDVAKFVLASTSSLYGRTGEGPLSETHDTNHPLSPYAATKKAAESLCHAYHHLHQLDVSILRYFSVYGPAGRPDMSIFRFVRQTIENEPITLYGDGTQRRDFTYVDDIARGTIAALMPLGFDILNLGNDRPVSLRFILDQITHLTGQTPRIEYHPAHPADPHTTQADITHAAERLDWHPETPIEEGLRRTVAWYQANREWAGGLSLVSRL